MKFDGNKVAAVHDELLKVLQKAKLSTPELVVLYGNLGYSVGASITGYKDKAPSGAELAKLHYAFPKHPGLAMMVQGELITTWYDDLVKLDKEQQTEQEENK